MCESKQKKIERTRLYQQCQAKDKAEKCNETIIETQSSLIEVPCMHFLFQQSFLVLLPDNGFVIAC